MKNLMILVLVFGSVLAHADDQQYFIQIKNFKRGSKINRVYTDCVDKVERLRGVRVSGDSDGAINARTGLGDLVPVLNLSCVKSVIRVNDGVMLLNSADARKISEILEDGAFGVNISFGWDYSKAGLDCGTPDGNTDSNAVTWCSLTPPEGDVSHTGN